MRSEVKNFCKKVKMGIGKEYFFLLKYTGKELYTPK